MSGAAFALAVLTTVVLVGFVRQLAVRTGMMDQPTGRGSHSVPTPRGGGSAVVAVVVGGLVLISNASGTMTLRVAGAFAGVVCVAVVGWLDDRRSVPPGRRLLVHALGASGVAWLAGSLPGPLGVTGILATLWWAFWAVAAINVTNFMDGIDGLVASQVAIFGLHIAWLGRADALASGAGALLAGASLGFLCWNWAPAKIFLGDVGSGALGLLLVLCGILGMRASGWPLERVFLPLLPFFLDASGTLARRVLRGERVWEAHRSHLYQRLANTRHGHGRVTLLYAVAAAVGVWVSHVPASHGWTTGALIYAVVVLLIGGWLDRRYRGRVAAPV